MAAATGVSFNDKLGVFFTGSFTLDPGSIGAAASEAQTVAVAGTRVGDLVQVAPRAALTDGLVAHTAHVSADGTITFTIENNHTGAINEGSATWDFFVVRGASGIAFAG